MRLPRNAETNQGMGLTPLVDVVFLLLIFFVVATSFKQPHIALDLPDAESAAPPEEREMLLVELRASGEILVDGEATLAEELEFLISARADQVEGLELRADQDVTHGRVVEVLDLARSHDVTEISIAVEAKSRSG